ncbi:MAG: hypothetical protein WBK76_00610 [Candidatus Saccharimonadales bacterium]
MIFIGNGNLIAKWSKGIILQIRYIVPTDKDVFVHTYIPIKTNQLDWMYMSKIGVIGNLIQYDMPWGPDIVIEASDIWAASPTSEDINLLIGQGTIEEVLNDSNDIFLPKLPSNYKHVLTCKNIILPVITVEEFQNETFLGCLITSPHAIMLILSSENHGFDVLPYGEPIIRPQIPKPIVSSKKETAIGRPTFRLKRA